MAGMADTGGNGPPRPPANRSAAGANTPMAKTIALVGLALIIGIVMINIVGDDGDTVKTVAPSTTVAPTKSSSTTLATTATTGGNATTTTAKASGAVIPPASLRLIVVNSGAPTGSGGNVSNALKTHGYHNQAATKAVTWKLKGLNVFCKPGLEKERSALVAALVGIPNYTAKAAAWKLQAGIPADMQCYVSIGAAA